MTQQSHFGLFNKRSEIMMLRRYYTPMFKLASRQNPQCPSVDGWEKCGI